MLVGISAAIAIACFLLAKEPQKTPKAEADRPQKPDLARVPAVVEKKPTVEPLPPIDREQDLMARIRAQGTDPAMVVALAREGNGVYPDSPYAEERAAMAIDALVSLERIGEAHREAQLFIERWPTGDRAVHVMNLMGVHPRPRGQPR
jgi:hypothetical protein